MAEPKRKYKLSPKTRARMRKAHLGKKHSPETIAKIRARKLELDKERETMVALGLAKPFHHSPATKAKLRKIALKQKRRHKLTKGERLKGAHKNKLKGLDRIDERRARKILAGQF